MICPDCKKGMVQVKDKTVRRYLKAIPCPRCNGSGVAYCCDGEDASRDSATLYGDQASTNEDKSLVA